MAVRGTPTWLGDQNAVLALRLMLDHGPLSRNGISGATGLSKQTAAQIVTRLLERGLIEDAGEESLGRGPSATRYAVRNDLVYGVAINIDQHGVRSTVVDVHGNRMPVSERSASGMRDRNAAKDVAGAVIDACKLADVSLAAVRRVSIGLPSSVDPRADELSSVEALPGWSRKSVRRQIEQAVGCEVDVDNDVNLAAIAERRAGGFEPASSFALIWLGYGIGLALDISGTVLHGAAGGAGEIGHLPVAAGILTPDVDPADVEALVGAAAIDRIAFELGDPEAAFENVLASGTAPTRLLEQLAPRVALGVIPVLGVVDPDVVVFGGPIGRAGGTRLAELTRAAIRNHTRWDPSIAISHVDGDPVLEGARATLVDQLREELVARAGSAPASDEDRSRIIASNLLGIN